MNVSREEFRRVKMAISEAEMNLLGDADGNVTQAEIIKSRGALLQALDSIDRVAHMHGLVSKPPKADL